MSYAKSVISVFDDCVALSELEYKGKGENK